MFAMITTEEYKELLLAQEALGSVAQELSYCDKKRQKAEDALKELLLMLTKGQTTVNWSDKKFAWHDLARAEEVAEYINKNYVIDGKLQFEKVKGKTDE